MKPRLSNLSLAALVALLAASACSTQMQTDQTEDTTWVDSTMIHPMNPDSDTTALPSSPADTMQVDTNITQTPL